MCFGIGVMLDASANVIAFLIQNVAIAHPKEAEGRFARRLRTIGIGMVVASLIPSAIGMTVAATHWRIWFGRWISPPERSLHRKPAGGRQRGAFRRWLWDFTSAQLQEAEVQPVVNSVLGAARGVAGPRTDSPYFGNLTLATRNSVL